MTISNLNQNNLKTIKEKKMELPSPRNMKTVHFARESLVSAVLKESTQIIRSTLQSCIPNRIPKWLQSAHLLKYFPLST